MTTKLTARLYGEKVGDGNGNGCRVQMESRGKLGNDEKVKFVGPKKRVRWREKTCGPREVCKLQFSIPTLIYISPFLANKQAKSMFGSEKESKEL